MKGWKLAVPLVLLLGWALVSHWQRARARLTVSHQLFKIEVDAQAALRHAELPRQQLMAQIEVLRSLEPLDPSEFGVPLAIGSHFLLLESPSSAIRWYEQALRLEMRPEILLNLARAQTMAGNDELAEEYLHKARVLDPLRFVAERPPAEAGGAFGAADRAGSGTPKGTGKGS